MHTFFIHLQPFLVDNDVGFTEVHLSLENQCHLHYQEIAPRSPQPTYKWTLDDASLIAYPTIGQQHAAAVFAISLSMQSWRLLYSPVLLLRVDYWAVDPGPDVPSPTIGMGTPLIVVDERSFLKAAAALSPVPTMTNTEGIIIRAAMNAYWDALYSVRTRSRFLSLYAAFELTVNASGRDEKGKRFDAKAAALIRAAADQIEPLRQLNRQLKHATAVLQFDEATPSFGRESGRLKRLTDRALAARLHFQLPSTYDE